MKVYTNTSFKGHYPVGVAAVIIANDVVEAAYLLNAALLGEGLPSSATTDQFEEVQTDKASAIVLNNGNY